MCMYRYVSLSVPVSVHVYLAVDMFACSQVCYFHYSYPEFYQNILVIVVKYLEYVIDRTTFTQFSAINNIDTV